MQTVPIQETISFSQLRTQTRRLEALLAAQRTVTLLKGSKIMGQIVPKSKPILLPQKGETPLFLKGFNLGKSEYNFVKRADFYE